MKWWLLMINDSTIMIFMESDFLKPFLIPWSFLRESWRLQHVRAVECTQAQNARLVGVIRSELNQPCFGSISVLHVLHWQKVYNQRFQLPVLSFSARIFLTSQSALRYFPCSTWVLQICSFGMSQFCTEMASVRVKTLYPAKGRISNNYSVPIWRA